MLGHSLFLMHFNRFMCQFSVFCHNYEKFGMNAAGIALSPGISLNEGFRIAFVHKSGKLWHKFVQLK